MIFEKEQVVLKLTPEKPVAYFTVKIIVFLACDSITLSVCMAMELEHSSTNLEGREKKSLPIGTALHSL